MVTSRRDEGKRHWTTVTDEDKQLPMNEIFELLKETTETFLDDVTRGNPRAVAAARRVLHSLAETFTPGQLACLLEQAMKSAVQNFESKQQG